MVAMLRQLQVYPPGSRIAYVDPNYASSPTGGDALAAAGVGYFVVPGATPAPELVRAEPRRERAEAPRERKREARRERRREEAQRRRRREDADEDSPRKEAHRERRREEADDERPRKEAAMSAAASARLMSRSARSPTIRRRATAWKCRCRAGRGLRVRRGLLRVQSAAGAAGGEPGVPFDRFGRHAAAGPRDGAASRPPRGGPLGLHPAAGLSGGGHLPTPPCGRVTSRPRSSCIRRGSRCRGRTHCGRRRHRRPSWPWAAFGPVVGPSHLSARAVASLP